MARALASAPLRNLQPAASGRRSSARGSQLARAGDGTGGWLRDNRLVNGHCAEPAPGPPREARGRLPRLSASVRSADPPGEYQVVADVALAVAVAVACLAVAGLAAGNPAGQVPAEVGFAGRPGWQAIIPAVAARTMPLAIRRFRPLTAFWLCLAGCLVVAFPGSLRGSAGTIAVDLIALVPAAYSAVAHSRHRPAALVSMPTVLVVLVVRGLWPAPAGNYTMLATLLVFIMTVLAVGNTARLSQRRAGESQARLLRLAEEQENATRQAIGHERARIARELHDVVTHNVSMMVVQAGAARRVLGASPDEARSALLSIEESGREAITELQHMLGLLTQPGDRDEAGPAAAAGAVPLRPQPGLGQVRPLIDRVTAAGLPVELRVSGTPRALPPGTDLAAYRVIQEALTNVIKHAGKSSATVTLDYRDDALVVEVADNGARGEAAARRRGAPGALAAVPGGRGLLGLRERVSLYGGDLDAGSQPEGGWRVRARFPGQPSPAVIPVPS
jgi:signal transduction histidine kinase